jgi:modification methylase
MQTTHRLHIGDARNLSGIADASVQLVVTSPPYPMIAMWDDAFGVLAPTVPELLASGHGLDAFEAMHFALDEVWAE